MLEDPGAGTDGFGDGLGIEQCLVQGQRQGYPLRLARKLRGGESCEEDRETAGHLQHLQGFRIRTGAVDGVGGHQIFAAGERSVRVDAAGLLLEEGAGQGQGEIGQTQGPPGIPPAIVLGKRFPEPAFEAGPCESFPILGEAPQDPRPVVRRKPPNGLAQRQDLGRRHGDQLAAAGPAAGAAADLSTKGLGLPGRYLGDEVREGVDEGQQVEECSWCPGNLGG